MQHASCIRKSSALVHQALDQCRRALKLKMNFLPAPGHVETTLRYAQLEQRQRNFDIASAILEAAIENPKSDTAAAFLAIHYAHSVERFARDIDRARGIYTRALGRYPGNKNLWLAAIDFEIAQCGRTATECHEDDFKRIVSLYQQAIGDASLLTEDEKLTLGQRYIETIHALAPRPEMCVCLARHTASRQHSPGASFLQYPPSDHRLHEGPPFRQAQE